MHTYKQITTGITVTQRHKDSNTCTFKASETYYGRPPQVKRPPPRDGGGRSTAVIRKASAPKSSGRTLKPLGGGRDPDGVRPQNRGADTLGKAAASYDKTSAPRIFMFRLLLPSAGGPVLTKQGPTKLKGKPPAQSDPQTFSCKGTMVGGDGPVDQPSPRAKGDGDGRGHKPSYISRGGGGERPPNACRFL